MRALLCSCLLAGAAAALDEEIAKDTTLPDGTHRLTRPLRVVADSITLDLGKAVLAGADEKTPPDRFTGIGLVIEGRKNVTIRGGRLRGFRCAILVKDCEGVVIEGVDVSGNYRQRLRSTPEREFGGDWLWPHNNDKQEWRKNYGAGLCLENSRKCIVRECTGRKQQNGVLLDRCEECQVYDNDMSFLSGWGLALWRSSKNLVVRNNFDWCVRGYSHGVYARGQDSAGILVFEQCNENTFAFNSATHGGDGFFLYAGHETTQRTGKGGCNGNLVYNNDFSHAVANAIEATFSKGNRFIGNRCDDSNYGVWAGYSYETLIEGNAFARNSIAGVAIEHGEKNTIVFNTFTENPRGIWLWWDDDKELLASKFGQTRPCKSQGYTIANNTFDGDKVCLYLDRTTDVEYCTNTLVNTTAFMESRKSKARSAQLAPTPTKVPRDVPGKRNAFLPEGHARGRRHILVDEWGPLDPGAHAVFPRRVTGWGACAFHVLGPSDRYEVKGLPEGLAVEKGPRTFRVTGDAALKEFTAEVTVGGKRFPIAGLLLNAKWRLRHWKWTKDPREDPEAWEAMLKSEPLVDLEVARLDFAWAGGAPHEKVPGDRFATRAETRMRLPKGRYEVRTLSDDGIRVWIDGKVVQADWTWHAPKENVTTVVLAGGEHEIVVEHFEIDGYAALRFDLRPVR